MAPRSAGGQASSARRGRTRPLIACVFGTRPQFVKVATVWRLLSDDCRMLMIDSGQHYDYSMAGVFYLRKGLPAPQLNLGVKAKSAGVQVSRIAGLLDPVFSKRRPEAVVTFGDTSTTAGAAIAAAYQNIPVAHIEAGLRSYDQRAPEEKNRVLTDHISRWLFCPTQTAVANLKREGITDGVFGVGDVMYDSFRDVSRRSRSKVISVLYQLPVGGYYFVTCHRAETVDDPQRLRQLVDVLEQLDQPTLFAVHPRARKNLTRHRLWSRLKQIPTLRLAAPLDHDFTVAAIAGASHVLTDSGGVQREAYWSRTPCLILRDRTEWVELVKCGAAEVVDLEWTRIRRALRSKWRIRPTTDAHFRKRDASRKIAQILLRDLKRQ